MMEYEEVSFDLWKADMFSISMVIFELITQDDMKFYYNENKTNYKFDRIQFDIDAVSKIYSEEFINLLKYGLAENPVQRISLEQSAQILNNIKKNSSNCTYCIRLHDDESKKKSKAKK